MRLLFTEREARLAIDAIKNGVHRSDGLLEVEIPIGEASSSPGEHLQFDDGTRVVRHGQHSTRLSPTHYALLKYTADNAPVSFEDVQDAVWGDTQKPASDNLIEKTCSNLSSRLLDSRIPLSLAVRKGRILLERIDLI